jgi:hypothetical protein
MTTNQEAKDAPMTDASTPDAPQAITLFVCGPKDCEHDYQGWEYVMKDGRVWGGTAICTKCGALAIDEAMWL